MSKEVFLTDDDLEKVFSQEGGMHLCVHGVMMENVFFGNGELMMRSSLVEVFREVRGSFFACRTDDDGNVKLLISRRGRFGERERDFMMMIIENNEHRRVLENLSLDRNMIVSYNRESGVVVFDESEVLECMSLTNDDILAVLGMV